MLDARFPALDYPVALPEGCDPALGVCFVDGRFAPIAEATVHALDWGFNKSDVTYDVAHVKDGAFFRLGHHLDRFQRSLAGLRMSVPHSRDEMGAIMAHCVRLSGLRDAYVAVLCTRGMFLPGMPRKPSAMKNRFMAYAIPWIDVIGPAVQERGAHLIVSKTLRIPPESVNPTYKNYHWGDLTQAMFEAEDAGADTAVLLDAEGFLTEGPGFNVFIVKDGAVIAPDRGALEGITRQTVFDLCDELGIPWREGRITREDLYDADEVCTCTTAGGVMPVARVDGRIYGNDRPGPISARLKETYWRWHDEGRDLTPVDYA